MNPHQLEQLKMHLNSMMALFEHFNEDSLSWVLDFIENHLRNKIVEKRVLFELEKQGRLIEFEKAKKEKGIITKKKRKEKKDENAKSK